MTKKTVSLLTVLTTLNIIMLPAFANPMGDAIVAGFQANTEKKIEKANAAKDYSGELTFMNNHLKLDKAFTKRYNELQPNEAKNCHVTAPTKDCTDEYKLIEDTTKKSNRENIEYWESQMQSARTLSALGQIYYCAKEANTECHYIGGAGGVAKTVNGSARFISKVSEFFGGTEIVSDNWDVRENIDDLNTDVSDEAVCKTSVDSAANTTNEYLEKLKKCEHIDQVRLSEYTEEDIQNLLDNYESKKENANSKANRLLTSLSMAATGVGGMELAQGLAEQKADKAADADMSAYISTMRCSYGNGKSVKAGTEEIELPGGNSANLMRYRSEYVALASDLKERKNALGLTPGIESEEILDKSQMGLYDDENVGITGGRYASLYRAQMLGSESDQAQLDEAKQESKNRVIGGAVAAGVGVVGGIVGDELINQSLSSSTKTAQTCTESGGTWQGARCHCPDGFIQRTKTGPCFEEKPTEVQTTTEQQTPVNQGNSTPPQDNNSNLSSGSNGDDNDQHGGIGDDDNNAGGSDEEDDSSIVDIANISFEEDEFESADFDETADAAVIEYERSEMCRKFDGNWEDGQCFCTPIFAQNNYIKCINRQIGNGSTEVISTKVQVTGQELVLAEPVDNNFVWNGTNSNDSSADLSTTQAQNGSPAAAVGTGAKKTETKTQEPTCGVVGKKECNSNYYVCASDSDCTPDKLPANATAGHCWKGDGRSVCTATACKDTHEVSQGHCIKKKVVERNDSAKSSTSTAQRPSTTEATKTNTEQKKTLVELIGRSNLNADPTNWRAKMNNGTTVFCEVKGDFMTAKMEKCSGLGEWWWDAKFSYGTIQGKSKCTKNSNTGSQTCYCYVSRYTNNNKKTYVFEQSQQERVNSYTGTGSAGYECAASCPKYCAQTAMSDYSKRQNIFNKSGVHQ